MLYQGFQGAMKCPFGQWDSKGIYEIIPLAMGVLGVAWRLPQMVIEQPNVRWCSNVSMP